MLNHEQIVKVMKEIATSFITAQTMDRDDRYRKEDPHFWHKTEYESVLSTVTKLFGAGLIDTETEKFLRDLATLTFYPNIKKDL